MSSSSQFKPYLALGAVYFFWGTTYLAIRMALESFPPLFLLSTRFLLSGAILMAGNFLAGGKLPAGRELWLTALIGLVMLGGGNGALVFAETWIPSGLAALFVTTSPFWMVGLDAIMPGGKRPALSTMIGIAVGFLGVLMLVTPAATAITLSGKVITGFVVLQLGSLAWSTGALLQRRLPTSAHPVVSGAIQQLATGLAVLPLALGVKEHPIQWSERGILALAWLVFFGSIVGYSAFIYGMETLPVAILSTYGYVNPVVAVFLGWLFYREPFGLREMLAMVAVFTGVAIVQFYTKREPVKVKTAAAA
ncbi:MAG: EamA family transporter [Bryobacteraceae bacterium]